MEDHANARAIATTVAEAHPGSLDPDEVTTNIVYVPTGTRPAAEVMAALAEQGILVGAMGPHLLRLVTHLDVDAAACVRAAEALSRALDGR